MLKLTCHSFPQGGRIPELCAFGRLGSDGLVHEGTNFNPHLEWGGVPDRTQSFVLVCIDDDVPTSFETLPGMSELSPLMPRRRFVHWIQANIPASVREIEMGALSGDNKGLVTFGVPGLNDYINRADKTPLKVGDVGTGYDGPNPPSQDGRWHVYRFILIALDTTLDLNPLFTWDELLEKMQGHELDLDEWIGRYSLNPRLQFEDDVDQFLDDVEN